MTEKLQQGAISARLKAGGLLLIGCCTAAGLMWAATVEHLPWMSSPAEAHGAIAPYQLPTLKHASEQDNIAFLQARIAKQPQDFSDLAALSAAYVHRARVTNDPAWYLLAEQAARRSIANRPSGNAAAMLTLCQVAQARHDFPTATRIADEVAKDHPVAVRPLRVTIDLATGKLAEAAKLADEDVDDAPDCSAHVQRGLTREARGDDSGAIEDYRWAIAHEEAGYVDASVQARAWLGRLHARHGRLALALELYREALRIAPGHGATLVLLAATELRLGQAAEAARHFDQAVAGGQGAPAMMGLADAEAAQGHRAEATRWRTEAEQALRRDLAGGGFGHRRDLARLLLAKHTPATDAEALKLMREEVALRQDVGTLVVLAAALERNKNLPEARAVIGRALATGAQDPEIFVRAASIEGGLGHAAIAATHMATAHRLDSGYRLDAPAALEVNS